MVIIGTISLPPSLHGNEEELLSNRNFLSNSALLYGINCTWIIRPTLGRGPSRTLPNRVRDLTMFPKVHYWTFRLNLNFNCKISNTLYFLHCRLNCSLRMLSFLIPYLIATRVIWLYIHSHYTYFAHIDSFQSSIHM